MELAGKVAHLVRETVWPGIRKGVSAVLARARRTTPRLGLAILVAFLAGGTLLGAFAVGSAPPGHHEARHSTVSHRGAKAAASSDVGNRIQLLGAKAVNLPAATATPVAASTALVNAPPIAARENFAFAPYWTLAQSPTFSLTGLSTLAYFSIGVNANGTMDESGPGWNGYQSQALSDLITRAHGAGERVVLTVNDFDQGSLDSLTSSPTAGATLSAALIPLLQAKSLDGINFDFEGAGSHDQSGLTALVAAVSGALRAADPHWQVTMDTYASSAGDSSGFYNIPALAPSVDAFFVMAYELNLQGTESAASPLTSGMFSDLTTLQQYTAAVPASKVILGAPFFGIDWPTSNGTLQAQATGAAADIADAQVQGSSEPLYWDPVTQTGWTSYQVGSQWHESYFESVYGLFQMAQLAAHYGVRGVGIWALGMEDDGAQMITAMDGYAPLVGPGGTGPQATSQSPAGAAAAPASGPGAAAAGGAASTGSATTTTNGPASPNTTSTTKAAPATTTTTAAPMTTGVYGGQIEQLSAVGPGSVDTFAPSGTISNFQSTNPAYSCLDGKSLAVYQYGLLSGKKVAVAATPTDCISQDFTFPG